MFFNRADFLIFFLSKRKFWSIALSFVIFNKISHLWLTMSTNISLLFVIYECIFVYFIVKRTFTVATILRKDPKLSFSFTTILNNRYSQFFGKRIRLYRVANWIHFRSMTLLWSKQIWFYSNDPSPKTFVHLFMLLIY